MVKRPLPELFGRALKKLCPACGKSPIFEKKWKLFHACPSCGIDLRPREPDTYLFMYVSTAGITGIFLIAMLLYTPADAWLARIFIILSSALFFIGSIPVRKSFAIALDYALE